MPISVAAALRVELTRLAGRIERQRETLASRYLVAEVDTFAALIRLVPLTELVEASA
jgi:hypothetical protein